jgi:hypothetical protein
MNTIEQIIKLTDCELIDAVNYVNALAITEQAYLNEDKNLVEYLEHYKNASDKVWKNE